MRQLEIGEHVTWNGRDCEVVGVTSMSVTPKRVFLRDLENGELVVIRADELESEGET